MYNKIFIYFDLNGVLSTVNKRAKRMKRDRKFRLLTLPGSLCVFSEVHNVHAQDLILLSQKQYKFEGSLPSKFIKNWKDLRNDVGNIPPGGWPLRMVMLIVASFTILLTVWQGYKRIVKVSAFQKANKKVFQSQQKGNGAKLRSEVFDGDSDTIIVDNSANCIIWRQKKNFDSKSYVLLSPKEACGVSSAVGEGKPVGIGTLNIGWNDDSGKFHKFAIPRVFHIPDSPVNILGVSAFSKAIGDFDSKGTRINSSGQDSVFSWDNQKFQRTFTHSDSNMPEMTVNDGYAAFYRFCNFLENMGSANKTCYHTHRKLQKDSNIYGCGEEVIYKNEDHVEKGIIEKVIHDADKNAMIYDVKFRDDRKIKAMEDNLLAADETDVSILPDDAQDFVHQSKCLTLDEIKMVRDPPVLSKIQHEWIGLHDQFGHLPFAVMDRLVDANILPSKFKVLKGQKFLCPSCLFGKMRKRAWRTKGVSNLKTIRKKHENYAGAKVSVDQLVVAQPGLVPRISGKHTIQRICGATGFFDNYTGYSYSSLQTSLNGDQTLEAKHAFESHAASCGVKIERYRADNGRFAEKSFRDDVRNAKQEIDYCGVGAHQQNGIIERHFQRLSSQARIILLHAKRHWPMMISVILWPFAYKYAELLYNHLNIDEKGYSPVQKFCKNSGELSMKDLHTWGCPCFVLDAELQGGNMKSKWEPRSRLGVYLGHSPCHAGTVALVLNPRTLHVSPQFHVAFDDQFTTVPYLASGDVPPNWNKIVNASELVSENDYNLAKLWIDSGTVNTHLPNQEGDDSAKLKPLPTSEGATNANDKEIVSLEGDPKHMQILMQPTLPDLNALSARRSMRNPQPSQKAKETNDDTVKRMFAVAPSEINEKSNESQNVGGLMALVTHFHNINLLFDGTINQCHHLVLATVAPNNDVYTLSQMLKLKDIKDFVLAMIKEIEDHESREHWELVQRKDLPVGAKTILSVWAFKRKRHPDGEVYKHKARLNAHGGMQRWGVDYWETYAPVVNWISIRLLLILTVVHKLETKSIDFVLAFPQAELKRDVFMELPYGFRHGKRGQFVLKLKKNLYGLAVASLNWFNKLTEGLEAEGFVKSDVDQCVFIRKDCVILVYVDDMIAISRNKDVLEKLVANLKNKNYILTDEGSLTKYLGVDVKYKENNCFEIVQPFLIQRVIDLLGITANDSNCNSRPTPAVKPLLHKDLDGLDRNNSWNYRTAIGMLTYLQGTTRPDISMAVHQCARFSMNPKLTHERAVKRIGRYLLGTKDRGIIYKPNMMKGLECYVDADFAGGWAKADADNPDNVLSRTGYIITYAGCPLIWASRMQTEISLSTAESEYIALSTSMRDVISIMQLMDEINKIFPLVKEKPKIHCKIKEDVPETKCKVYEDNESCIAMAKNRQFSPRTKHIAIKYHHFRRLVNKTVTLHSIDTNEQMADALTKPLDATKFEYLRKKYCGW